MKYLYTNLINFINEKLLDKSLRSKNLLYHSTSFSNLLEILDSNVLISYSLFDFGISTSRNKDYLFSIDYDDTGDIISGGGECQLILDKDKIKSNYKIKPYDYEMYKKIPDNNYHQSEDKILSNKVKNIKKYIVGIHLNKNVHENYKKLLEKENEFIKENNIIIFDKDWNIVNNIIS